MFNAEAYWADKPIKKWVVYLSKITKKSRKHDVKIVSASTSKGAIRTAKFHSMLDAPNSVFCRLAEPTDLGCVPNK